MKRTLAATAVILAALLLAGCTSSGGSAGPATSSPGSPSTGNESGGVAGKPGTPQGSTSDVKTANRDVITTGSVSITVKDPIRSAQDAVTITEQAGGRVDNRTENPGTDIQPASANLTLRIPANDLDRALAELRKLGTVNFVSLSATDVTLQTRDLDARITALKASVDRLLALLQQATNTTDLIAIESALSSRQSDLESLQSQRDYLSDQIDYATITLNLYAEGTIAPGPPGNFWAGLLAGWMALMTALGGLLVGIGFALPWLLALGLVGAIVLLIIWLSTRGRKAA